MINLAAFGDLSTVDVGAFAPKPTSLTGNQQEAAVSLWTSPDGSTDIGVWECTPGRFASERPAGDEYCHIISGRATLVDADGSNARDMGPGDLLILPKGWKGEWTIHEHMRKLYVTRAF